MEPFLWDASGELTLLSVMHVGFGAATVTVTVSVAVTAPVTVSVTAGNSAKNSANNSASGNATNIASNSNSNINRNNIFHSAKSHKENAVRRQRDFRKAPDEP